MCRYSILIYAHLISTSNRKEQAALAEKEAAEAEMEAEEGEEVEGVGEIGTSFQEIDKLQDLGVNVADIKKLKTGGCHTIVSLLMNTRKVQHYRTRFDFESIAHPATRLRIVDLSDI